ncbi:hypothetical protein [Dyadobacter sp. CY323]|uniref:hypothetical protein n=1 Tax=Dyadobacter sp. CY323 TaxID=2907302 RepID=UPI001F35D19D|nr:hypothetical protein [Dyadobacter sp. CY323]MCE6991869.1 hypothetical protein [Dyadobacter sp. CY323]
METAIKKKYSLSTSSHNPSEEEEVGPLMIWNGTRSNEEVAKMSEWVSKRSREIAAGKASMK